MLAFVMALWVVCFCCGTWLDRSNNRESPVGWFFATKDFMFRMHCAWLIDGAKRDSSRLCQCVIDMPSRSKLI